MKSLVRDFLILGSIFLAPILPNMVSGLIGYFFLGGIIGMLIYDRFLGGNK